MRHGRLRVLKALGTPPPYVVFATAYDEYAIRAFEVQAIDYLLKPFARARVLETVARVRARRASADAPPTWTPCSAAWRSVGRSA